MIELTSAVREHLERGGTLVVPSPQRAAAVRLAYSAAKLRERLKVWDSPDVLPWYAWLERGLDEARTRGVPVPRRLSRTQEWWLWRDSVHQACVDSPVLTADALIESVRRAVLLIEDYGLGMHEAASPEVAMLLRARAQFARGCLSLRAIWCRSWRACEPYLVPQAPTRLVGFATIGGARREWLQRIGVELAPAPDPAGSDGTVRVRDFEKPELEAQAAAQWCAEHLQRDPAARLLLVIPRLAEQGHRWLQILSQRLDYQQILPGGTPGDPSVAVEGGQPLTEYPLVTTALRLLSLASGPIEFDALSALLRSPFLQPSSQAARLALDVWMRQDNVHVTGLAQLRRLLEPDVSELEAHAAEALRMLVEALDPAPTALPLAPESRAAHWARHCAAILARAGWPGAALSSEEQQIRARFDELLSEFATASAAGASLEFFQAVQLLHLLASGTAYEPATDDVPVTLTSRLDDPIVRYDGIWIAGLTAEVLPAAASPDPLIPWVMQQSAGMPTATAAGTLGLAEQALRDWRRAGDELCLSWSRSEGELPRDASPLLARPERDASADAGGFELEGWMAAQIPPLEHWRDTVGPEWSRERQLPGGTRMLKLQAQCPFRGFAEMRLRARPLPEPLPGIDPRLRGLILHQALQFFWESVADSRALHALGFDPAREIARRAVERAIADVRVGARSPDADLLRREGERNARLLEQLVEWELQRPPFAPVVLEQPEVLLIDGAALQIRLDRIDQLDDGRLIVFDYKSGAPEPFDAFLDRPRQPQLPAYAMAAGNRIAAVAGIYLGQDGLRLRGIADRAGRIAKLPGLPEGEGGWPVLLERWRAQLHGLAREFLSGHAAVQPQRGVCQTCHLRGFCRIPAQAIPPP